ncbi:MAG TPA: hypothetical protein VK066_13030 [Chloroflexota bacterium]|nr:hypothetical protein [Chloroflexota bacterium]
MRENLMRARAWYRRQLLGDTPQLLRQIAFDQEQLRVEQDELKLSLGKLHATLVSNAQYASIQEAEFKVFSQFGEDGIIQYLIRHVPVPNTTFVEFGVEDYREANTRFLLMSNNWRGLIIDAGTAHLEFLRRYNGDRLLWSHEIHAISAFVTRANINDLIRRAGISGDIGLLSIDIDGNDYWIFDAIDVITPRIVVIEYNSTFGPELRITVPYKDDFNRLAAHHGRLYFGASLAALCDLAEAKGYAFVGSDSVGVNAFFVRKDVVGTLPVLSAREGYVESRVRESRGADGSNTYISQHRDRLRVIADMEVYDLSCKRMIAIRDAFGLATGD